MMKATKGNCYQGVALSQGDNKTVAASQANLIERLVESMTNRFQDASVGVLCATKLVDFKNWPESGEAARGLFSIMFCMTGHSGLYYTVMIL